MADAIYRVGGGVLQVPIQCAPGQALKRKRGDHRYVGTGLDGGYCRGGVPPIMAPVPPSTVISGRGGLNTSRLHEQLPGIRMSPRSMELLWEDCGSRHKMGANSHEGQEVAALSWFSGRCGRLSAEPGEKLSQARTAAAPL
ncbi:hypothetical protein NDU88_003026 [Pleurodeles waltl]|uniref:Uncharacterized protein n=1 Tax=Pleurodeles waltl TaxID=8319 RepID=A0AAV7MCQ9_PLEWA|nr:hypothetical protein NDU88_003026 [Pleurodeles waltl]